MKYTIEELIAHLNKYKDAVVIVGPYATESYGLFEITDKCKDEFNRKNMVKKPKEFWKWYKENIFKGRLEPNDNLNALMELYSTDTISKIISTSYEGILDDIAGISDDVIPLVGSQRFIKCVKCHSTFCMSSKYEYELNHCSCGGRKRPTVLMPGEVFPIKEYSDTKRALFNEEDLNDVKLNTHTLICIGVDFEQPGINELVQNYKALMNKEDQDFLVLINEKDSLSIEQLEPEFATQNDIAGSINRLVTMIKEEK